MAGCGYAGAAAGPPGLLGFARLREPTPQETGADWQNLRDRLGPPRTRWDPTVLANLADNDGPVRPADLIKATNAQSSDGQISTVGFPRTATDGSRLSPAGAAGQTVTVTVRAAGGVVRVEVTDRDGSEVPQLRPFAGEAEDGRGVGLEAGLAARWSWRRSSGRTVV
jgi:hypothetical protein